MRYVKGHGLQTRSRIVEEASYGLRQRGADGLSVADWVSSSQAQLFEGRGVNRDRAK